MDSKQYAEQMLNRCAEMIVEALKNMSIEDINMYQIGYEKGKADAIEEYKIALHTKYKENKDFAYSVWEGNIYKYDAMANLDLEEIDEIAEQLKEQINE